MDQEMWDDLCHAVRSVGDAITPPGDFVYVVGNGNKLRSLTDAVIYAAEGLWEVADAFKELAHAVGRIADKGE